MKEKSTTGRYSSPRIAIHWLMLLLLIAVYACIELRELYPKGSDPREALKQWHFMLGLSVFVLLWVRVLLRLTHSVPGIEPPMGDWTKRLAGLMHLALYLFMLGMPLLGWLVLSAKGKPIPFFGLELPALISPDKPLAERLEDLHKTIGTVGYYLIGLHAAASLLHHYVFHDNTLLRMLPDRRKNNID